MNYFSIHDKHDNGQYVNSQRFLGGVYGATCTFVSATAYTIYHSGKPPAPVERVYRGDYSSQGILKKIAAQLMNEKRDGSYLFEGPYEIDGGFDLPDSHKTPTGSHLFPSQKERIIEETKDNTKYAELLNKYALAVNEEKQAAAARRMRFAPFQFISRLYKNLFSPLSFLLFFGFSLASMMFVSELRGEWNKRR